MMTMRILPDSNALMEVFKGTEKGKAVGKHLKKAEIVVSSICIYEILHVIGKRYSKRDAENFHRSISMRYRIFPVDERVAVLAAEIRRKNDMPMADCLIYATAKANNAKVISGCRHFRALRKERDVVVV